MLFLAVQIAFAAVACPAQERTTAPDSRATGAISRNLQEVIPVGDPIYDYLDLVMLEAGLPQASSFRPYTAQEFSEYLELLDLAELSPRARSLAGLIGERLQPAILTDQHGQFGFAGSGRVSAELYAKGSDDADYIFARTDRLPMLTLPIEMWFFESVYATTQVTLREDPRLSAGRWETITYRNGEGDQDPLDGNHFNWFSLDENLLQLDWYFPDRALISIGGPHWHLTYGRDDINVGNGSTGNLVLSDVPDYYDSLLLSTHWRFAKISAGYIYLEPWLTELDQERLDSDEYFMRVRDYGLPHKGLVFHQLELRPLVNFPHLPQLLIFAGEMNVFGSQYPQIRDFNPLMIFHNWFAYERQNDSFLLGVNFVPLPHLELYGQYFLMEFDTPYEDGGNYPGAAGWMGGVRASHASEAGVFSGFAEYVLTDPLLYNRYHPLLTFVSRRRIWSYIEPDQFIYYDKTVGYRTGPDTAAFAGGIEYRLPPQLAAELTYSYIAKGEKNTLSSYQETPGESTPTGVPELTHVGELSVEYAPIPLLSVGGSVYLVHDRNVGHITDETRTDFQTKLNVTVQLSGASMRRATR